MSLDVRADGEKQVLTITNYNADQSLYKPKQRSNSMSIQRQDTMSSSTIELFEAVTEDVSADLAVTIELAGVGISLVNRRLVEVIYMVTESIKLEYTNSVIAQAVTLACGHVQVDNQLHEALYPVILQPTPLGNQNSTVGALPTVQASVTWLKDQGQHFPSGLRVKLNHSQNTGCCSSSTAPSCFKLLLSKRMRICFSPFSI